MPANLPTLYTTINLAGATSSINLALPYIFYIYESVGGNLTGNYTIQASGTPTTDTIINIKKKGNISLNGFNFTVFGVQLTEEQANKELSITAIYNFTSASWDVFIDIDTSQLPSIYEGVESTAVPTSGTKTLLPNINKKWQVFTGAQTLVGNYTITGTGSQNGQEFWIIWNSTLDLNGNTLSIFGLTIPAGDAISGNFSVYAKYNGSAWVAKFFDNHYGIWKEGSGVSSVKKIGSTSTVSGDFATDLGDGNTASGDYSLTAGAGNTASQSYSVAIGDGNTASGSMSIALGLQSVASSINAVAIGDNVTASGIGSLALGDATTASGPNAVAMGIGSISSGSRSLSHGYAPIAARWTQRSISSGKHNTGSAVEYAQGTELCALGTTNDATPAQLTLDGASEVISIATNSAVNYTIKVLAVQDSGAAGTVGDVAVWDIWTSAKNVGGTSALVGSPLYMDATGAVTTTSAVRSANAGATTWDVTITVDNSSDSLFITVTGQANKTIYWHAYIVSTEIKFAT